MTKPNILIIMADQLAPQFTGAYGHHQVKTPHMDALAARGARFDAAYCNAPLCAPSRMAFMTGQHVTRIAAYDNASEFKASVPSFAHYLRRLGYTTCLSGKMHFVGPDQMHGFDERITTDVYPADFAWVPDWEAADERIDDWYHNMDSVREAGLAVASVQMDFDEEVAFHAKRKLFDYARKGTAPFAMVASFTHPHDPYEARPEFWNLYDHDAIDMPKNVLAPEDQDPMSKRLMDGIEASKVEVTEEQVRNSRHAYFANISYFDSKVGELVQVLEESGQLDDTVVIITADHGDMLGERGLWYKMNFFEHSARVPLIMAGPGIANTTVADPCSLVDILPTLLDLAGEPSPSYGEPIDGRSLAPQARGEAANEQATAIGEYCAEMTPWPVLMIRRGQYKYIHCDVDPPQLFDVVADPYEMNNLVDDPAHTDRATAFAAEVAERWDSAAIRADVIATQHQRRAVYEAMQKGQPKHWDYTPPRDASDEYVRNHITWVDAAVKARVMPGGVPNPYLDKE
ncbi:choline-sulfatase [Ahrensia sp. R2A130]|uniref:choline-sulfatase n=1 Tax=Ahrensia sp. R2A130 TaxID=744979 RepID=UPI0001E0ACD4|nr:choline-sulfatase [Ahrensia sp. R2A130]EFL88453.1 choline-sulfatase [Ahrensia sp. R2A130]